jgi:hypothetical protein
VVVRIVQLPDEAEASSYTCLAPDEAEASAYTCLQIAANMGERRP